MSDHSFEDLSAHFASAAELPEAERERYLEFLGAEHAELAAEVRRMLSSSAVGNDFLEPPAKTAVEEPMRLLSFDFRGLKLGEFTLVKEIGRGASGVVYSGTQEALERKVAIKILAPHLVGSAGARERFQREALAASSLRHPAVVNVLSCGEQQGVVYLVLEYVEGKSLHQYLEALRLARDGQEPREQAEDVSRPEVAAAIALQLAEGLEYCHRQGVLHRDIKPQNILLEQDLSPRIVDFGLAKDLKLEGITDAGLVSGTLHYMSPEQAQARSHELDARTDVYSLGVVLYEMLTLRRPFDGTPDAQLVNKVLHERPLAPHHVRPEVPKALSAICLRALEKSPGDRYERAAELAQDLRAFLRGRKVAVGARLRFEDAYRYVFLKRPWIAVTGVVASFMLMLALSGQGQVQAGGHEPTQMASSQQKTLQLLLDKANSEEERDLIRAQMKVIEHYLPRLDQEPAPKER